MNRFRSTFKLLFVLAFILILVAIFPGSAAAETDVYQGILFHPYTLDGGNGTCVDFLDDDIGTTRNCDPVNLVFPGRAWMEVRDLLLDDGWSTCCEGTRQGLHYGTPELHLDNEQLVKPNTYTSPRYHIRLWQVPNTKVTFAAVHHEYFDWASLNHIIDMDWEQAEADVANALCGQNCGQTGMLTTQSAIQGDDGTWRPDGIDNLINNASATVIPGPDTPNIPPTAADDSYSTSRNTPLSQSPPGVLSNDSDVDGDPLTAALISDVTNGTLMLYANGSFDYQPNLDFVGNDSFTYIANDGTVDSTPATVTIVINQVNYLPIVADDSYSTDEDMPLSVAAPGVLGNDSDPDGDELAAVLVADASNGILTLNGDGSFLYTPDANFSGDDSFTYVANDGSADSNVASVTITVNPAVDPPAVDQTANGEEAVAGTTTGSFVDTQANDAAAQTVTERESGGKKNNRYSFLEHKWTFDIQSGDSVTFYVNAWRTSSNDGDAFVLAYSTDGNNYQDMLTVNKTSDDDTNQSYALPATTSGLVYVRVRDTDLTAGNRFLDTITVDHMFIRTQAQSGAPPASPTDLAASAVSSSQIDLTWTDNATNESGFAIERSPDGTAWSEIDGVGPDQTTFSDTGLSPDTPYFYRVRAFNGSGPSAYSDTATASTLPASGTTHVHSLSKDARITGPGSKWEATVTITVYDEDEKLVQGATVSGVWSAGASGSGSCQIPTDINGRCNITRTRINGNISSVTFTVTNITHPAMPYDPSGDPGNHNGDSIVVDRP